MEKIHLYLIIKINKLKSGFNFSDIVVIDPNSDWNDDDDEDFNPYDNKILGDNPLDNIKKKDTRIRHHRINNNNNEVDIESYSKNLKDLKDEIKGYEDTNSEDRGAVKTLLEAVQTGNKEVKDEAEKIAKDLNVEVKDVLHMENRLSSNDASFDAPVISENDDEIMSPSQYIEDHTYDPEIIVAKAEADDLNHSDLSLALKMLDDRSKDILQRRYLADEKATLHDLADEYGVSAERIRQIENGALKKLKALMVSAA